MLQDRTGQEGRIRTKQRGQRCQLVMAAHPMSPQSQGTFPSWPLPAREEWHYLQIPGRTVTTIEGIEGEDGEVKR